jgi:predicted transcriptional regulator
MSDKYKTKINIISSILESCIEGNRRSHITTKFDLSHYELKFYYDFLLDKEFLSIDDNGLMRVTNKGKYFLERLIN